MEDTDNSSQRIRKYAHLINSFLEDKWPPNGQEIQMGIEGRIFEEIVQRILDKDSVPTKTEERHQPKPISPLFHEAALGVGRPIRTRRKYYLPDFTLADNLWIDTTLLESEAHKKAFLYAHQCDHLVVIYLCPSRVVYFRNPFPNTIISSVYDHFSHSQIGQHSTHLLRLETVIKRSRCHSK
jgi:hypothetical protein